MAWHGLCGPFPAHGRALRAGIIRRGWSGCGIWAVSSWLPLPAGGSWAGCPAGMPARGWIAWRCRPVSRCAAGWLDEMRTRHADESGGGGHLGIVRPSRL